VNCQWGEGGTVIDLSGCFVGICPEEEKIIGKKIKDNGLEKSLVPV